MLRIGPDDARLVVRADDRLGGLGGVAAWSAGGPEMGPLWYVLSIPASAAPCILLGAWKAK